MGTLGTEDGALQGTGPRRTPAPAQQTRGGKTPPTPCRNRSKTTENCGNCALLRFAQTAIRTGAVDGGLAVPRVTTQGRWHQLFGHQPKHSCTPCGNHVGIGLLQLMDMQIPLPGQKTDTTLPHQIMHTTHLRTHNKNTTPAKDNDAHLPVLNKHYSPPFYRQIHKPISRGTHGTLPCARIPPPQYFYPQTVFLH